MNAQSDGSFMKYKKISRRQFLKTAGATAAGAIGFPYIVASSAMGKAGSIAASNRITVGCIGMGSQGMVNLRALLTKDNVQVVAICDVNPGSSGYHAGGSGKGIAGREPARRILEKHYAGSKHSGTYKGYGVYNDFRKIIERKDVDAVVIALPDHWHGIVSVMAAQAGKDIYGEKPLAYNIAEGRAICDAVKKYGIVWQTGSQQRSDWKFHRACELVRNERIGKLHTVRISMTSTNGIVDWRAEDKRNPEFTKPSPVPEGFDYDMWLGPAPWKPYCPGRCHWNFRWISDYASGQINDWSGHHCDIAQWGMGTEYTAPVEIEGKGLWPQAEDGLYDTVEHFRFVCKYAEGHTLIVTGIETEDPLSNPVRFEGTAGWVEVSRRHLSAHPKSILDSVIGPSEIHLYKSNDHIGNFIDCVKSRSLTIAPAEVAHRSVMIGHLGVIAIRLGRKVKWDPRRERFIGDDEANRLLSRSMRSPWHL